eukprot:767928-Hanusia_phi.AAC.1
MFSRGIWNLVKKATPERCQIRIFEDQCQLNSFARPIRNVLGGVKEGAGNISQRGRPRRFILSPRSGPEGWVARSPYPGLTRKGEFSGWRTSYLSGDLTIDDDGHVGRG